MNRLQFSEFVKDPGMTNPQSIKMLEELIRRYPYCQTGQLLYAFNLFREENLQYPIQLKKAAAYAGDRRILRELIDSAKVRGSKPKPPEIRISQQEPDLSEQDILEKESISTGNVQITGNVETITNQEPVPIPGLKTGIYPEIFGAVSLEELATFQPLPENPGQVLSPYAEVQSELNNQDEKGHFESTGSHDRMTHEELLAIVKKRLAEIDADKHRIHAVNQAGGIQEQVSSPGIPDGFAQLTPRTKDALIDKFIKEEPKISKPKAEFFSPTESAVRSNFDEEEIVSETLAKLYAAQGNISKAVHIYQKLSLLNQEKSRYFAAQIENLKS